MEMKFTPGEIEIIKHRLAVPDAIVEALEEMYDPDLIESNISKLEKDLKPNKGIDLSGIQVDIIRDCIDASTWFVNNEDWKPGEFATWSKVAQSLENKFGGQIPRS